MKNLVSIAIVAIISFCLGYSLYDELNPKPIVKPPDLEIIYRDSLVRDTLWLKNDSIEQEQIKVEKKHTEIVDNILSASDSTNLEFFSNYIDSYDNK